MSTAETDARPEERADAGRSERARATGESRDADGASTLRIVLMAFQTGRRANGGLESITRLVESLARHDVLVVTQLETPFTERWRRAGARVEVWNLSHRYGEGAGSLLSLRRMRRITSILSTNWRAFWLARRSRPCVVHANDPAAMWHTGHGARLGGAKVLFNIRGTKPRGVAYGRRWRSAVAKSDLVVVLSREMRDMIERDAATPGGGHEIRSIYSLVDSPGPRPGPAERATLRERLGMRPDELAIGFVAQFHPDKCQLELIERTLGELARRSPAIRVHFLGDYEPDTDDYSRACRDRVRELGLESHVAFHGFREDVGDWYRALDIVTVATRKEGLARAMIESLAHGTPVVSFAVCSAREILEDHDCGRVVPEGDYDTLTATLAELAGNADLREQLGARSAQVANELFRAEDVVAAWESVYRELLEKSPGRA